MESNSTYHDYAFIRRWLEGSLSSEEAAEFESWLADHPEEVESFEKYRLILDTVSDIELADGLAAEKRWHSLSQKLGMNNGHAQQTQFPVWQRYQPYLRIAALFVLAGMIWLWLADSGMTTVEAPFGKRVETSLPDGSIVTLNAGSKLSYNEATWSERRFLQLEGEAYFDVIKGSDFVVESGPLVTSVLGTEFIVNARSEAVEVACFEGRVRVGMKFRTIEAVVLTAGFRTSRLEDHTLQMPQVFDMATRDAWRRGEFYFQDAPLAEVAAEIERQFDCKIQMEAALSGLQFSGKFDDTSLDTALEIICLPFGLAYDIENSNNVEIKKNDEEK